MEAEEPNDRYALCFDSDEDCLGEVALRLIRLGIDVVYARSADEAFLLAGDNGQQIRAVVVPPSVAMPDLERVLERISNQQNQEPVSVVVMGEKPAEEVRARLRLAGAEWAVWNTDDDSALRYAVNGALTLPSEVFERRETRVPTNLMASFWLDDARGDAVIYTLSARGAFLETPRPIPVSTRLQIEVWLPNVRFNTAAKVIYANVPGGRSRASWPVGVGVVFEELADRHEVALRGYITERANDTTI